MFPSKTPTEKTALDLELDRLYAHTAAIPPTSDDYAKMVDQLIKLQTLKDLNSPKGVSNDVKATIIANLAGIAAILWHERAGIVTSKAISFVRQLR